MTALLIASAVFNVLLIYLVWVLAERNRRLTVKCKDQRNVIADMRTDWLDEGEVTIINAQSGEADRTIEGWYTAHPGVNPVRERGEK